MLFADGYPWWVKRSQDDLSWKVAGMDMRKSGMSHEKATAVLGLRGRSMAAACTRNNLRTAAAASLDPEIRYCDAGGSQTRAKVEVGKRQWINAKKIKPKYPPCKDHCL
jgi:hypothetical protein